LKRNKLEKKLHQITTFYFIVDVLATAVAFFSEEGNRGCRNVNNKIKGCNLMMFFFYSL